ncbi:hypothetical protein NMR42_000635 [Vibrio cholerae]|nr:hypothetical protein [Vibrio cholerae]
MKATAKSFFGTNLEQEVLDEVVLLPNGNYTVGVHQLLYPMSDFEEVRFFSSAVGEGYVRDEATLDKDYIMSRSNNSFLVQLTGSFGSPNNTSVLIKKVNDSYVEVAAVESQGVLMKVVGYKRRISRVGIDELMSAMSLPNLIANADLTDNPINQRGFNGNWSSLAVGAYGYDQWMKVSATHMGAVIEAGKYRPSTKHTFTKDDVVLGEFMSPASGHWIVAVPFATSGKFDLYAGQFKRPWHPVQDGMQRCLWFFEKGKLLITGGGSIAYLTASTQIAPKKAGAVVRVYDNAGNLGKCSFDSTNNIPASATIVNNTSVSCTVSNSVANTNVFANFNWQVESSITLAEVGGQITTV